MSRKRCEIAFPSPFETPASSKIFLSCFCQCVTLVEGFVFGLQQISRGCGKFDAVVVWKFDRFARSVSHLLRALEAFQALGIEFVSLTEGVDTSTPTGKMVFEVLGAVAELERSLIAERVRVGLSNARAKGKVLGRPKKGLDASRISSLRAAGHGWRAIAKQLG